MSKKVLLFILAAFAMVVVFGTVVNSYPNPFNANSSPGCKDDLTNQNADQNSNSPPAEIKMLAATRECVNVGIT